MNKYLLTCFAVFSLLTYSSCGGDEESAPTLPSNLQVAVEISDDEPGKVNVTATAENAIYYMINFAETANQSSVKSTDGTESYTYTTAGTYTIRVAAHSTASDRIKAEKEVTIELPLANEGYVSPGERAGYNLVWEEQFEGTSLNTASWNYEVGAGGWGNQELQFYRQSNTSVKDGFLTITARKEAYSGSEYTSARLTTKGKKKFTYGRMDIRAKLPRGQGIWPAIWMLGENISQVNWQQCGEIDIMEMIGGNNREATVHGTIHFAASNNAHVYLGGSTTLPSGTFSDKFHVYSLEWTPTALKWYVDDVFYHEREITSEDRSEFHNEFFFILNVAVGGVWPQYPDATTQFPQQMHVDYIRVFQPQ